MESVVTVRELMAKLAEMPPHARILMRGYGGGSVDIGDDEVRVDKALLNVETSEWMGPHALVSEEIEFRGAEYAAREKFKNAPIVDVVLLGGFG